MMKKAKSRIVRTHTSPIKVYRTLGLWKGKVKIAKDFDRLPADLLRAFQ